MATHSTPAGVVVEYFETLRWLANTARNAPSPTEARRSAAMSIILAVTAVEVFLNLWFRVYATERSNQEIKDEFFANLASKITLDQKLTQWPLLMFGKKLSSKSGPGGAFTKLKARRNSIVHFESTNDTVHASNIIIHGLADTTDYDCLNAKSAEEALQISEALISEIFRLADFDAETSLNAQVVWTGSDPLGKPIAAGPAPWIAPHVSR
jgi:hypothetical protein